MKRIIPIIIAFLIIFSTSVFAAPETVDSGAPEIALTDAEKNFLADNPKLTVFMKQNRYPYSYYEDGRYQGIYVEYLNKISELSGIEFIYIPYESDEQLEEYFTMGKADALVATYGEWTGLYKTTDPYTIVEYDLVAPPEFELDESVNYKVALSSTDVMLQNYLKEHYPNWTIVKCNNIRAAMRKVDNGKADISFVTSYDLHTNLTLFSYKNVEIQNELTLQIPVSIAISTVTRRSDVVELINKFIVCEPMKVNVELTNKYVMNNLYVPDLGEFLVIHKELAILVLIIVVALIVAAVSYMKYMKRKMNMDPLTGIWNREKFINEAKKKIRLNKSTEYLIAIIDVERFKLINDRFGVEIGNQTLKRLAKNLASMFKGKGIFGRNANDKFVVMLQDTPQNRELLTEAAQMDMKINNATYYQLPIKVGVCTISFSEVGEAGITAFIDHAKYANAMIKGNPDKIINYFTKQMGDKLERENDLETIMRKSLLDKEFMVYYQPKYSLDNNKIIGAEALVRWQHPTRGLISPGEFIPIFEKNGFIVEVDFYVYEAVMKMIKSRIDDNKPVVPVSMNVSRCHLSNTTFTKRLDELVKKYNIPKHAIEMEITESIFSEEDKAAVALMDDLKEHGFTLSMDDFGSGYSSLNLLRELPIDTLKIDRGFLEQTDDSKRSRVIVEEIIQMATKIDIRTICEGVETEQQRDFLKQAGCHMAQGFFYARPMPQVDFETLLDAEN